MMLAYVRIGMLALALAAASGSLAQSWPTKPVRTIIPAGQGGTIDPITRLIADGLSQSLGQRFVPDNRTGAQGNTGLAIAAKAEPDGYTLAVAASSMLAINPHLYRVMPYDPLKDLALIALIGDVQNILVVNNKLPVKSLQEFTDYAKAHPDQLNFGSTGNGSSMHLAGELFKTLNGVRMTHVPYKVPGDATTDLIAGRIQVMFQLMTGIHAHVKAGSVRAIAVLSDRRSSALPDVPTTAELGMGQLRSSVWFGVVAPTGAPEPVIRRVAAEVERLIAEPKFRARVSAIAVEPLQGGPDEFRRKLLDEYRKWGEIVKVSGAKIE
ncbi:MAG: tripartite tricarboxylate transporter substrate binding protein [Burkholderiales bacterium]|nr:tripartite tricarboxylate transporter substrate binding protein [Burkholderiales bacterium]